MKLRREFYAQDTLEVARQLLGKTLVRNLDGRRVAGRIVETEAYLGPDDTASHSRHGPLSRAKPMFGEPGYAYIYFTYGMYHCVNCVTEPAGSGTAVLIRALEPLEGTDLMREYRQVRNPDRQLKDRDLANGPGKLAQALQLDKTLNGVDLTGSRLWLEDAPTVPDVKVGRTARIGISKGRELEGRFYVIGSESVSRHPKY